MGNRGNRGIGDRGIGRIGEQGNRGIGRIVRIGDRGIGRIGNRGIEE